MGLTLSAQGSGSRGECLPGLGSENFSLFGSYVPTPRAPLSRLGSRDNPLFPRGHRRGLGSGLELAVEGQLLWLGHEGDRCWALVLGSVSASCPVLGEVETGRPCSVGIVPVPRQGVWLVTHPEML